jgi:hypothetical protein
MHATRRARPPRAQVKPHLDVDYGDMTYRPVVWFNEFWLLRDKLVPLNGSVAAVPLQLSVYPLALWKFTIYQQMEQSFNMQARRPPARRGSGVFGVGLEATGKTGGHLVRAAEQAVGCELVSAQAAAPCVTGEMAGEV